MNESIVRMNNDVAEVNLAGTFVPVAFFGFMSIEEIGSWVDHMHGPNAAQQAVSALESR